jgi:hypothetical protein
MAGRAVEHVVAVNSILIVLRLEFRHHAWE